MSKTLSRAVFSTLLVLSAPVLALDESDFRFGGFGSLGVATFSNDDADYVHVRQLQPKGPGRSATYDFGFNSVLGAQLDVEFSPAWSATVQAAAFRHPDRSHTPELTLGVLSWRPSEAWQWRAGRMQNPGFLYSDSRLVGFGHPWAQLPIDVYGLNPLPYMDGAEALYETEWAGWRLGVLGGYTEIDYDYALSNSRELVPLTGDGWYGRVRAERGPWLVQTSWQRYELSLDRPVTRRLSELVRPLDPALANRIRPLDQTYELVAAALAYEGASYFLSLEYVETLQVLRGTQAPGVGWLLSAGRHWGDWTGHASLRQRDTDLDEGLMRGPAGPLMARAMRTNVSDTRALALGMNYAFNDSLLLKAQIDFIRPHDDSFGLYFNTGPGYDRAEPGTDRLISLNLDFVF